MVYSTILLLRSDLAVHVCLFLSSYTIISIYLFISLILIISSCESNTHLYITSFPSRLSYSTAFVLISDVSPLLVISLFLLFMSLYLALCIFYPCCSCWYQSSSPVFHLFIFVLSIMFLQPQIFFSLPLLA